MGGRTGTCRAGTWLRAAGRMGRRMARGPGGLTLQAPGASPDAKFWAARAWWRRALDRGWLGKPLGLNGCVSSEWMGMLLAALIVCWG